MLPSPLALFIFALGFYLGLQLYLWRRQLILLFLNMVVLPVTSISVVAWIILPNPCYVILVMSEDRLYITPTYSAYFSNSI